MISARSYRINHFIACISFVFLFCCSLLGAKYSNNSCVNWTLNELKWFGCVVGWMGIRWLRRIVKISHMMHTPEPSEGWKKIRMYRLILLSSFSTTQNIRFLLHNCVPLERFFHLIWFLWIYESIPDEMNPSESVVSIFQYQVYAWQCIVSNWVFSVWFRFSKLRNI